MYPDEGNNLCNAFVNLDYSETKDKATNFCLYFDYESRVLPEQPACFYYTPQDGLLFGSSLYHENKCYINKPEDKPLKNQNKQHELAIRAIFDTSKNLKKEDTNIYKNIGVGICNDDILTEDIHNQETIGDLSKGIYSISCTKQEILLHKYNSKYFCKEYASSFNKKKSSIV